MRWRRPDSICPAGRKRRRAATCSMGRQDWPGSVRNSEPCRRVRPEDPGSTSSPWTTTPPPFSTGSDLCTTRELTLRSRSLWIPAAPGTWAGPTPWRCSWKTPAAPGESPVRPDTTGRPFGKTIRECAPSKRRHWISTTAAGKRSAFRTILWWGESSTQGEPTSPAERGPALTNSGTTGTTATSRRVSAGIAGPSTFRPPTRGNESGWSSTASIGTATSGSMASGRVTTGVATPASTTTSRTRRTSAGRTW